MTLLTTSIASCTVGATGSGPPRPSIGSVSGLPVPADVAQVSGTAPGAEAQAVMNKCQIGPTVPLSEVTGMGKIAFVKDAVHYVGLTGREPQLQEGGSAWIVQIKGELRQPTGEIWTDPTCVVTLNDFGWYATGKITEPDGTTIDPLPAARAPDLGLPTLAP